MWPVPWWRWTCQKRCSLFYSTKTIGFVCWGNNSPFFTLRTSQQLAPICIRSTINLYDIFLLTFYLSYWAYGFNCGGRDQSTANQLNPMGRLGCTLLSLILSKPMTPFQGMHYGNTLGVHACLRLCCLWFKTCTTVMRMFWRMVIRLLVCIRLVG
jgi:hypothetical protein